MSAAELDLSSAVAEKDVESYTLTEGEVASLGGGGKFPLAVVLAAITALFLGVFFGWAGGSGMSARQLINQRIDNAGTLSAEVTNVSKQLAALHAQLDTIAVDTGYRPEFDDALRAAFTGDKRPVLSGDAVAAARVVLAYDARLSGQLIDFSVGTQIFAATVDRHLAQARAEVEEIQREAEGKEDPRGYGILFNFDEQAARYQQYLDNTQAPSFLPVPGLRVRFGELTLVTNEKGGSFTIDLPNGQQQAVPAYNLIVVDKGQLVEGTTTEPASARHARRARQIKEQLAALVEAQGRIGKQLDELSAAPKVFVFP